MDRNDPRWLDPRRWQAKIISHPHAPNFLNPESQCEFVISRDYPGQRCWRPRVAHAAPREG